MPSWNLKLSLCFGRRPDTRIKKSKNKTIAKTPTTKTVTATENATTNCPQCGCSLTEHLNSYLQQQSQQDRTGIPINPWSTVRMQKSVDSGICEELSGGSGERAGSSGCQLPAAVNVVDEADAESDAAADLEVSNIVNSSRQQFRQRRPVVEGVALRGFVPPPTANSGWHASATLATLPRDSPSSSVACLARSDSDDSVDELDEVSSGQRQEVKHDEQRSKMGSYSRPQSRWTVHQQQQKQQQQHQQYHQLLREQKRTALLWAMASVRDRLEKEMERLLEATADDLVAIGNENESSWFLTNFD